MVSRAPLTTCASAAGYHAGARTNLRSAARERRLTPGRGAATARPVGCMRGLGCTAGEKPCLQRLEPGGVPRLVALAEPPAPAKRVREARIGKREFFYPRKYRREVVLQEVLQHAAGHRRSGVFVIRTPPLCHQAPHGLRGALNELTQLPGRLPTLILTCRAQASMEVGYHNRFQVSSCSVRPNEMLISCKRPVRTYDPLSPLGVPDVSGGRPHPRLSAALAG
jgi:hypothetical protein